MDAIESAVCCGCLSTGRKVLEVDSFCKKTLFLQLIDIRRPRRTNIPLHLCWECTALVTRFSRFKTQAKKCYQVLQASVKQNTPTSSKLQSYKIFNLSLPGTINTYQSFCEIVKIEEVHTEAIKKERTSSISDHYSDEDDKLVIDLRMEKVVKQKKRGKVKDDTAKYKEIELTRDEIVEERRLLAGREDYTNAMFRCDSCIVTFPNAEDLVDHEKDKHDKDAPYKCETCVRTFANEVSFKYHKLKHSRRYQCSLCDELLTSKRQAVRHCDMHCRVEDYDIVTNSPNIAEDTDLEDNATKPGQSEEPPPFPCECCTKRFRWKTSLRKHMETHRIETGQKRRPYCEPCSLSFSSTSNLQKHVKTSSKHQIQLKLRKLNESLPDVSTPEKEQSVEQIKRSVSVSRATHACGQCGARFQWRGNLLRHLHSHAARAKGELVCKPCNRTFSSIATYKQHMKISKKHNSENDFKYMCSDCGKRFANKTRLKDHVNWEHLKNFVHKCGACEKVFKSHTSLYLHKQVVHRKHGADHLCDHCGKPFPNKAKLRCHMVALHTSESPYACGACSARFSWHSCLSRHVRRVHRHAPAQPHPHPHPQPHPHAQPQPQPLAVA